jgi:hypothetical protein
MSATDPKGSKASFTLMVDHDIPELGVVAGEVISFDPGDEQPFGAHRYLSPTIATFAACVAVGGLRVVEGTRGNILRALMQLDVTRAVAHYSRPQSQVKADLAPVDVEAALRELASPTTRPPEEKSGPRLLRNLHGAAAWDRFWERRRLYESRRPRVCRSCGATFTLGRGRECGVTCNACKAAHRKRCVQCDGVFTADSNKEKRCEPCLAKAAQAGDVAAAERLARKRDGRKRGQQ